MMAILASCVSSGVATWLGAWHVEKDVGVCQELA